MKTLTKFKYKDKVIINNGFYSDLKGVIIDRIHKGKNKGYKVDINGVDVIITNLFDEDLVYYERERCFKSDTSELIGSFVFGVWLSFVIAINIWLWCV